MQICKFFLAHFWKLFLRKKNGGAIFANFGEFRNAFYLRVISEDPRQIAFPDFSDFSTFFLAKFRVRTQKIPVFFENVRSRFCQPVRTLL